MANTWIKMRTGLFTHPKVVRISSALKADALRTVGGLMSVWCLFDEHAIDGKLDGYRAANIDDHLRWPGFAQAMIGIGWLLDDGESLAMPEFEAHNGQSAKRRAQEADRKREDRKASASNTDTKRTREEKRREDISTDRSSQTPPLAAVDSMVVLEGTFEGNTGLASPNPVAPFAIALTRAGFQVTTLNPELIEFQREGGSIEHLEQLATQDQFVGKPATYLLKAARRELTERPSEIRLSLRQPPASNTEQGLIGLERLKKRPRA